VVGTAIKKLSDAMRKLRSRQQDAMAALVAAQSNIRAKSRDCPLVAAAGVRTPETNHVIKLEVLRRGRHFLASALIRRPPWNRERKPATNIALGGDPSSY
jgi:hypothetical protein